MTEQKTSQTPLTEPFPIQVLCHFIQPYIGDRESLNAFLTNCKNNLASSSQKTFLLKCISRLEGKTQIACSNKVFDTFDALKSYLQQNLGEQTC